VVRKKKHEDHYCPGHDDSKQTCYREELRCNICSHDADFIVQLQLVKEQSDYKIIESVDQMPFFLCKKHEYVYKRMQNSIELKGYFAETIKENQ
jgi:hypothetical protein